MNLINEAGRNNRESVKKFQEARKSEYSPLIIFLRLYTVSIEITFMHISPRLTVKTKKGPFNKI